MPRLLSATSDNATPIKTVSAAMTRDRASSWPSEIAQTTRSWLAIVCSIAVTAVLVSIPFWLNHRYYFIDDAISEVVPKAVDIGRMVLRGEFPWISTNIMNGGGYAHEYIMGVFNPVNLVLYMMQASIADFATGAYIRSLVHCCIIASAVAWLARSLAINTILAVALAVSVSFNPYTIAWTAAAWVPGLSAFTWLTVAVSAMIAFHLNPSRFSGWLIVFGTYCCLTSGYPHAVFILGLFGGSFLVVRQFLGLPLGETLWFAAWQAGGLVCALIAIVPLLAGFEVTGRDSGVVNSANFNVAPLEALLQFANPSYYGFFNNWGGYQLQRLPQFYAAWFLLPLFIFYRFVPLTARIRALMLVLLGAIVVTMMMAMGPEKFLVFRFPTRGIQYFHFFLIVLAACLVAFGSFSFSPRRLILLLSAECFLFLNAMQADPDLSRHLRAGSAISALFMILWWCADRNARQTGVVVHSFYRRVADGMILVATVGALAALAVAHPVARGVDWGYPAKASAVPPLLAGNRVLFLGGYFPVDWGLEPYLEYRYATTGLLAGGHQINGYSSIGNRSFRKYFPIDDHGNFAPGSAPSFSAIDPSTGRQYLELVRADRLVALNGPMVMDATASLGNRWIPGDPGKFATVFSHAPYALPGLVSYVSNGIVVEAAPEGNCHPLHRRECIFVRSDSGSAGTIVFARLWLPGYSAKLNGLGLKINRKSGFLVEVEVPAGVSGILELTYLPPGLRITSFFAMLTLGILLFASTLYARIRRNKKVPLPT